MEYQTKSNIYLRYYSACDYDEIATEMVFPNLMEGEIPDYNGGSDFTRLDELKNKSVGGQMIKHWAGTIPKTDDQGKVINKLKEGSMGRGTNLPQIIIERELSTK